MVWGHIFAVASIFTGAGILIVFGDWIGRNLRDALFEDFEHVFGDVVELPAATQMGGGRAQRRSDRLTGDVRTHHDAGI
jgi:hypothetical protein